MRARLRACSTVPCLALASQTGCRRAAPGPADADANVARRRAFAEGWDLSPGHAANLERALERKPADVLLRVRLLSYYFKRAPDSPEARAAHARHVRWVVENEPGGAAAGLMTMRVVPEVDAASYALVRALWLKQVARYPSDANVAGNAALFLDNCQDRAAAMPLFLRARELAPAEPRWPRELGGIRASQARWGGGRTKAGPELACEALAYFKEAYQKERIGERKRLLQDIADSALACGDLQEATLQARHALESEPEDGTARHEAQQTLGRIALRQGDTAAAVRYLIASGKVPASAVMRSFGPRFELAQELLARGQRDAVLEYIGICRAFWYKKDLLDRWEAEIRAGKTPRLES